MCNKCVIWYVKEFYKYLKGAAKENTAARLIWNAILMGFGKEEHTQINRTSKSAEKIL